MSFSELDSETVVVPDANRADVEEIPTEVREKMDFVFASHYSDVFEVAFPRGLKKVEVEKSEVKAESKEEKPLSKEEKREAEIQRVKERSKNIDFNILGTASVDEKDDLKIIKGVGPFIEEKLNALGIYTFSQISKMTSELEDQVNEAIEFFPGRVKRDEWAKQAKDLLDKEDA